MRNPAVSLVRPAVHTVLGNRRWIGREIDRFAAAHRPQRVLEIGSGRPVGDGFPYSMRDRFSGTDFVMSDVEPAYGHATLDVNDLPFHAEFDAILCISVLEHVPDPRPAAGSMLRALRPGGVAVVGVPFAYPLHDEPADYWRFTEHGLRLLLSAFGDVEIRRRGPRALPSGLMAYAHATP